MKEFIPITWKAAADRNAAVAVQAAASSSSSLLSASASPSTLYAALTTSGIALTLSMTLYFIRNKTFSPNNTPPWMYKVVWLSAFVLNLLTVSLPGRFDGAASDKVSRNEKGEIVDAPVWYTIFEPAGWAFAIWAVIYITEVLITGTAVVVSENIVQSRSVSSVVSTALRSATPFWLAGNLFQSFWCGAFRPIFKDKLWLPMCLLALGAVSFGGVQRELSLAIDNLTLLTDLSSSSSSSSSFLSWPKLALMLLRVPLSLHTGWLASASLLNFNAWVGVCTSYGKSPRGVGIQISAAFFSAYLAFGLGSSWAVLTKDPFISLTVAWALAALAYRTAQKAVTAGRDKTIRPNVEPCVHEALAMTEKTLSNALIWLSTGIVTVSTASGIKNSLF